MSNNTEILHIRITKSVLAEIDEEAKKKGVKRSRIVRERIEHYQNPVNPEFMVNFQNYANRKYAELLKNQPKEAEKFMNGVNSLWKYLY